MAKFKEKNKWHQRHKFCKLFQFCTSACVSARVRATIWTNDIVIRRRHTNRVAMENIITCISLSERLCHRRSISCSQLIWKPMHHCQPPPDRMVVVSERRRGGGARPHPPPVAAAATATKRVHLLAWFKRWRLRFT